MKVNEVEKFFYRNPGEKVHLRELARRLNKSTGYVKPRLEALKERNVIEESSRAKMKIYSADTSSKKYRRAKKSFNIWQLESSELVNEIDNEFYPEAIILFGSYLEGRDHNDSDIDIAVIGGREESLDLSEYEREFERYINLTHIKKLQNIDKEFKSSLSNGYVLSGYLDLF